MTSAQYKSLSQEERTAYYNGQYFLFGRFCHCICGAWIMASAPVVGNVRTIHYSVCAQVQEITRKEEAALNAFKARRMRR